MSKTTIRIPSAPVKITVASRLGKGDRVIVKETGVKGKVTLADNIKGQYNVKLDSGEKKLLTRDQLGLCDKKGRYNGE